MGGYDASVSERGHSRPRKPISKRLRFEVYKRDEFACTYCGRTPPSVELVLDHVVPHADGGEDDATNLVTSCQDCNAGKSNVPLGDVMPHLNPAEVDRMAERVEVMREYRKWRVEYDTELRQLLTPIWAAWVDAFNGWTDTDGTMRDPEVDFPSERVVLEHLTDLSADEITEAVRIAAWKRRKEGLYRSQTLSYFYGTLRGMARRAEEDRAGVRVTWEELAAAVPTLAELRRQLDGFRPLDPWSVCGTRIWEEGWVVEFADGSRHGTTPPLAQIKALVGPKSDRSRDPILGSQRALELATAEIRAVLPLCGQTCACGRPKRPPREEDLPRCSRCRQTTDADHEEGCAESAPIEWNNLAFRRVPHGWESWWVAVKIGDWGPDGGYRRIKEPELATLPIRCPDCRAPRKGYHHVQCPSEPCPVCGEKGYSCAIRGHMAGALLFQGVSLRQAMASLRKMKPKAPWQPPASWRAD